MVFNDSPALVLFTHCIYWSV